MDLKNTKVTEPPSTENRFKNLVQQSGTVKVSAALKSTSPHRRHRRNQDFGLASEGRVTSQFVDQGWSLLFQRLKTNIAEVDLIFGKGDQIRLVEVKTLNDSWRSFQRISHRQVQKLILNQIHLSYLDPHFHLSCWVAWVETEKIRYVRIN